MIIAAYSDELESRVGIHNATAARLVMNSLPFIDLKLG